MEINLLKPGERWNIHICTDIHPKTIIENKEYNIEIMDSNVETMNITYDHYLHIGLDQLEVRVI